MSDHDTIEYVTPTEAQTAARNRRSYAIGGALAAFTALVFLLMIVKFGSGSNPASEQIGGAETSSQAEQAGGNGGGA